MYKLDNLYTEIGKDTIFPIYRNMLYRNSIWFVNTSKLAGNIFCTTQLIYHTQKEKVIKLGVVQSNFLNGKAFLVAMQVIT